MEDDSLCCIEDDTHVLPPILRDCADALDEPESRGIRVLEFRNEHRAQDVDPCLSLCRFACAQVRVGRRVDDFLLRISPHSGTEKTVGDLQKRMMLLMSEGVATTKERIDTHQGSL